MEYREEFAKITAKNARQYKKETRQSSKTDISDFKLSVPKTFLMKFC